MSADAFVLAATDGRRTRAERLLAAVPEIERDRWARLVLGRGWEGEANERQHAAWHGDPGVVLDLLGRGADPGTGSTSALAWAVHGSRYNRASGTDHVAVAEALVSGGAAVEPRFVDEADGPLYDWLAERPETTGGGRFGGAG